MKIKTILTIAYMFIFLSFLFLARYFVKIMLFDQKTADKIIIFSLTIMIALSIINFIVLKPIVKIILALQEASKKNAAGHFTTIEKTPFVTEISLLLRDYNRMVEQLDNQLKQIKQSEKEKIEMISNLSHDIKTPISSLTSLGQALSDNLLNESEKNYYYQSVLDNAKRISDLSDELSQLVESQEHSVETHTSQVWIDASVIKVLNAFKGRIDQSEREIVIQSDDSLSPIYSNESAIFRILYNIIDNSLKYSKEGTPIHITIKKHTQMVQIAIKDFGQGIAEKEQDKIFERTYRVEKSRNQLTGGNGLGLSISQKLVERIGGKISVFSVIDEGTTFYVELPYKIKMGSR